MIGKTDLIEAIAGKNRGLLASDPDKQFILSAIARLEERNPTPRPTEAADLLAGDWRLLYTTSQELLNLDRFKTINDSLGYTAGDRLLQTSATKLLSIFNVSIGKRFK